MSERSIPALVVSGFLGSGKTTLVRHLLEQAQRDGRRLAVVSNEFGALGIDQALLGEGDEAFVELDGGCVCCKLSDELRDTLQMLRERIDPDAIVVETSGVALPNEVQLNFWREPIKQWVSDDAAVIVVNAEQLRDARDLGATFDAQVSSADLLLLNKTDLVPEPSLPELEDRLRIIEPDAPLLRSQYGRIGPDLLFPPDPEGLRARRRAAPPAPEAHTHEEFSAEEVAIEDGIEPDELVERLRELGPLRAKGFVRTAVGLRLVQGVGPRIELTDASAVPSPLIGRVVLIRRRAAEV